MEQEKDDIKQVVDTNVKQLQNNNNNNNTDEIIPPAHVKIPLTEIPRFLNGADEGGERIALASYPRSGNSLVRRLIESITGVVTGSDTKPGRGMAELLRNSGLIGEGETRKEKVWVIKTHFPERTGWQKFKVQRAVLLIRHPINAIKSYFHMQLTATHHLSLDPSEFKLLSKIWNDHIVLETEMWKAFHKYWLTRNIPVIIVRYEDLLINREYEMKRLYRFLYRTGNGDDVVYNKRILNSIIDLTSGHVYKPRSANIEPNFEHYTEEQKQYVLGQCQDYLHHFGYLRRDDEEKNDEHTMKVTHGLYPKLVNAKNKGKRNCEMLINKGTPSRPATADDPCRRGFPWKWELRKIVKVIDKRAGTVIRDPRSSLKTSTTNNNNNNNNHNNDDDGNEGDDEVVE